METTNAMAEVIDMTPEAAPSEARPPAPDIAQEYADLATRIDALADAHDFWRDTLANPYMMVQLDEWETTLRDECERWLRIKPSEFRDSQALARAHDDFLKRFRGIVGDVLDELKAAQRQRAQMEIEYPILLAAAGAEREGAEAPATEPPDDDYARRMREATGVRIVFDGDCGSLMRKRLEREGFKSSDGDGLCWDAAVTDGVRAVVSELQANGTFEEVEWRP